jgi:septum site-determining protein MinD
VTRIVSVVSGKGGTGKTTVTSNLGVALQQQGEDVLIIDGNFSGANVAQHFGLGFQEMSLNDVLGGDAYVSQAVAKHPTGVSVLPASILEFDASADKLKHSVLDFLGNKDFVLIDAAAGTGDEVEAAIEASDETLLVTQPELPSLTNTLGAKKLAEARGTKISGVIVNGVRNEKAEVEDHDIKELLDEHIIGRIPDHRHVREGIALRRPVVDHKPDSPASHAIQDVAYRIRGETPPEKTPVEKLRLGIKRLSPL